MTTLSHCPPPPPCLTSSELRHQPETLVRTCVRGLALPPAMTLGTRKRTCFWSLQAGHLLLPLWVTLGMLSLRPSPHGLQLPKLSGQLLCSLTPSRVRLVNDQQDTGGQENRSQGTRLLALSLQSLLQLAVSLDQGPQIHRTAVSRQLVCPSDKTHTFSASSKPRRIESHLLSSLRIVNDLS